MTYPSGWTLTFDYGTASALNERISRLESLKESTTVLEGYEYLGLGTVVERSHPVPDVDLTYVKRSGESNGDAGDPYIGLDRFGRVVDLARSFFRHRDRLQYTYDRNGNRTARTNLLNNDFDEEYGYDSLNQLISRTEH